MTETAWLIFGFVSFVCITGVLATRAWVLKRRQRRMIARLEQIIAAPAQAAPPPQVVLPQDSPARMESAITQSSVLAPLQKLLVRSGLPWGLFEVTQVFVSLLVIPPLSFFAFGLPVEFGVILGIVLCLLLYVYIARQAEARRMKFIEQLPDAIDLMISVLRSGLSVPQSVKSVADELPAPCGLEFSEILHRMNLGQPLHDAMSGSVEKYESFELDLIRRAISIQFEVGGSLAELLEKTNATLRQRLKMKRHIRVLTSQSRLSGVIIFLMPFFVVGAMQVMNPFYLTPMFETNIGKILIVFALLLQVAGALVIRKLSSFKV